MDQCRGNRIVAAEIFVDLRFGQTVGRRVTEWILLALGRDFLAPAVEDIAEGALAGAVTDKAVFVLQLLVVASTTTWGKTCQPC
jgi:hypothetical protein